MARATGRRRWTRNGIRVVALGWLVGCAVEAGQPEPELPEAEPEAPEPAEPPPRAPPKEPEAGELQRCHTGDPVQIGESVVMMPVLCRAVLPQERWTDPPPIAELE